MECINFDRKFELYMKAWMDKNSERLRGNTDLMEEAATRLYVAFQDHPFSWLGDKSPRAYFEQFGNAQELTDWLVSYVQKQIPVPDLLMERIVDLGDAAEAPLLALFEDNAAPEEAVMLSISLLRELGSVTPMQRYIDYVAAAGEEDDKAELCADALQSMGEAAQGAILAAVESAGEAGKEVFADLLSNYPGNEQTFRLLKNLFETKTEKRAYYASLLAKYGDVRALPILKKALEDTDINYLDFIEMNNAVEALGGEGLPEREFSGDPFYDALGAMEQ